MIQLLALVRGFIIGSTCVVLIGIGVLLTLRLIIHAFGG